MFGLLRWILTWPRRRQLLNETKVRKEPLLNETNASEERILKEAKAREERILNETNAREDRFLKQTQACEAEMRMLWDKIDRQQAQALRLDLRELQRTMDPLIAAQAYNNRVCPLTRLPEELLLNIIDFLADDPVTLHCLQIVSAIFLRLLGRKSVIWKGAWYWSSYDRGQARHLRNDPLRLRYIRLLQRDGRCDNCRRWNDAHMRSSYSGCQFKQIKRHTLHCHSCGSLHDISQFSHHYQLPGEHRGERQCLGQQGSVQLCEHVQITWASIKARIDAWRQQQRGGQGSRDQQVEACLGSFNIECHDASYDTCCTASEAPTWPLARLAIGLDRRSVRLILEWTPHSRIDALALTADGRIPAPELRALFQRLRRLGPVDTLYSSGRPGALPEMALFSASKCLGPFVYYKRGEDDNTPPPLESFPPLPSEPWLLQSCCQDLSRRYNYGENGRMMNIGPHYPRDAGGIGIDRQCLAVTYAKDVKVCEMEDMRNPASILIPTHDWLHAMDTSTYPHPQSSHIRPQCRDETCTNYYQRRKGYYCCYY